MVGAVVPLDVRVDFSMPGAVIVVGEAIRQPWGRHAVADVAVRARHPRSAATASVLAFPCHMGMGLTDPAKSEAAPANQIVRH